MKSVVLCFAVVLGVASAIPLSPAVNDCPTICPDIYNPVCGSDGIETKTFGNKCEMLQYGCMKSSKFNVRRIGKCATEVLLTSMVEMPDCNIVCPLIYAPVCTTNGKSLRSFDNQCMVDTYNCEHPMDAKFVKSKSGEC